MNLEKFLYLLQTERPCDIGEKGFLQSLPSCGIMFIVQKHTQTSIREEELKNRVVTFYFGKYDCTRMRSAHKALAAQIAPKVYE